MENQKNILDYDTVELDEAQDAVIIIDQTLLPGEMTKDLALITTLENPTVLNSEQFIKAIAKRL